MRRAILLAVAGALPVAAAVAALRGNGPDPFVQAQADGCARDRTSILTGNTPNWAYVNDKDYAAGGPSPPARWVRGVVNASNPPQLAAHPAVVDNPFTHLAYDFIINVLPDPPYANLLGGSADQRTSNYAAEGEQSARLHTEREARSLPSWAWPDLGDRVQQLGSWVWDCDHDAFGERSEFHAYRALWVERNPRGGRGGASRRSPYGEAEADLYISTEGTPAAIQAECGHRTKGDREAFKRCLRSTPAWLGVNGAYRFKLLAPRRPSPSARLRVRVVDRGSAGAPAVLTKTGSNGATVSLTVAAPEGKRVIVAKQIFLGWTPMPIRTLPEHLRVRFDRLLVRRAMDPSCPVDRPDCSAKAETLKLGQIAEAPGEWNLYWNVGGIWGQWRPALLRARDGQTFPGSHAVDLYVDRDDSWRLFAIARECDHGVLGSFGGQNVPVFPCPKTNEVGHPSGDDSPGSLQAGSWLPARSLGTHTTNSILANSSCPPVNTKGCFALTFTVARIDDAAARASLATPRRGRGGMTARPLIPSASRRAPSESSLTHRN